MVKKIFHVADLHLKGKSATQRKLFETRILQLIESISKEVKSNNLDKEEFLIIVAGDILDNKSKTMCPHETKLVYDLLKGLTDIGQTDVLIGNHDFDRANPKRLDNITPVYEIMLGLGVESLKFIKSSTTYRHGNLNISHISELDDDKIPDFKSFSKLYPSNKNICVYHNIVNGCTNHEGLNISAMSKSINKSSSYFNGFDAVLLGDIHLMQKIDAIMPMYYSGSPWQLSYGERVSGHGYLIWDVEKIDTNYVPKFIELENLKPLYNSIYDEDKNIIITNF